MPPVLASAQVGCPPNPSSKREGPGIPPSGPSPSSLSSPPVRQEHHLRFRGKTAARQRQLGKRIAHLHSHLMAKLLHRIQLARRGLERRRRVVHRDDHLPLHLTDHPDRAIRV